MLHGHPHRIGAGHQRQRHAGVAAFLRRPVAHAGRGQRLRPGAALRLLIDVGAAGARVVEHLGVGGLRPRPIRAWRGRAWRFGANAADGDRRGRDRRAWRPPDGCSGVGHGPSPDHGAGGATGQLRACGRKGPRRRAEGTFFARAIERGSQGRLA